MSRPTAWLAAGLAAASLSAGAANLQISPVTIDLRAEETATAITLTNAGSEPLYGQVRVFGWDQTLDDDKLSATADLMASPPLIQVPPGGQQIIRLLRVKPQAASSEQTYRMLVDEIAPPSQLPASGVTVRLRYSVPIFVNPAAEGRPELNWTLHPGPDGWQLEVANRGNRRAQISAVKLLAGGRAYELNRGLMGYALAGRTRRWRIPLGNDVALAGAMKIQARINASPIEAPVTAERRR
ncbi:molecular chaperone [Bordetella genomosp. 13]|uniref:fimbrial biogenesis chaperone n=1 Tax=Bordetella genomosp. 13 TaxID=463040 RepID=UPI0011A5B8E8|nr:molecular chaperone [Bordetella genomosp. 13]